MVNRGLLEEGELETSRIRRIARDQNKEGLPALFLKQAWTEAALTWRRRVRFRVANNADAVRAYCAMTEEEFENVNARQRWANWRTIPRSLSGRLPARPCRAVDLCSGLGHSTQVLAYYLPTGSEILGLEFNPEFVLIASSRDYRGAGGEPVPVAFRAQSVLDAFRDGRGDPLPDASVDLVNSCGSLGIHFDAAEIDRIAAEAFRVLEPGALAAVDSGPEGIDSAQMVRLFQKRRFEVLGRTKSCFLDRFTHVCFRKPAP
jgi:SAM-dependent methyltransferase